MCISTFEQTQTPADVINPLNQQAEKTLRQGFPESVLLNYSKVGFGASTAGGGFPPDDTLQACPPLAARRRPLISRDISRSFTKTWVATDPRKTHCFPLGKMVPQQRIERQNLSLLMPLLMIPAIPSSKLKA